MQQGVQGALAGFGHREHPAPDHDRTAVVEIGTHSCVEVCPRSGIERGHEGVRSGLGRKRLPVCRTDLAQVPIVAEERQDRWTRVGSPQSGPVREHPYGGQCHPRSPDRDHC